MYPQSENGAKNHVFKNYIFLFKKYRRKNIKIITQVLCSIFKIFYFCNFLIEMSVNFFFIEKFLLNLSNFMMHSLCNNLF